MPVSDALTKSCSSGAREESLSETDSLPRSDDVLTAFWRRTGVVLELASLKQAYSNVLA